MNKAEAKVRIEKLRQEVDYHRHLYHVLDKQEISDSALDSLKHELYLLEQEWPELITADSPTQRVAGRPVVGFKKVKHLKPVISIEDAFSMDEVEEWQTRNEKFINEKINGYFGELKMDGLSIVLVYENGRLSFGATRGDGKVGEEVTSNLRTIESIPLHLDNWDSSLPKRIDIRGEVVIYKKELERINSEQKKKNLPLYANPRNLAAGTIRQLDAKITATRQMFFFAFEIITDVGQHTHAQVHEILKNWGFKTNPHCQTIENISAIKKYVDRWAEAREKLPYQTDGVVLVINDIKQQRLLGSVGKTERWMLAYKFPAEQATTRVKDIIVQVGRTGVLTPVALLEPVKLAGTTVSRATLHNEDEIKRLGIKIGDTVIVQKAGDIIPDIVKTLVNLRVGKEKTFVMPKKCPVCGSAVTKKTGEVAWYCTNKKCFAIEAESMRHFVGRQSFNIDGLGPKIIDQLLSVGLIKDVADLFSLKVGDLKPLERFAEKSADNLVDAIQKSKKITLARFIHALGIRHVGQETAVALANNFYSLENLLTASQEQLEKISDIGPVVANSLFEFFNNTEAKKLISRLLKVGVEIEETRASKAIGALSGKTVVITGSLQKFSREEAKQMVRDAGGKSSESVSKNTDYVLSGENPGSKLTDARRLGVKVVNEKDFLNLLRVN